MRILLLLLISVTIFSCESQVPTPKELGFQGIPIFEKQVTEKGDTVDVEIPFVIPQFRFLNQDSVFITNKDFENKVYVVDFFFTKCPPRSFLIPLSP